MFLGDMGWSVCFCVLSSWLETYSSKSQVILIAFANFACLLEALPLFGTSCELSYTFEIMVGEIERG